MQSLIPPSLDARSILKLLLEGEATAETYSALQYLEKKAATATAQYEEYRQLGLGKMARARANLSLGSSG